MRNGWKGMRWATLTVFSAWVSLPTAAAQVAPTVEGAQQFLAVQAKRVTTQVRFVDVQGRTNYVTGKVTGEIKTIKGGLRKASETSQPLPERSVDKQLPDVRVAALDATDALGRQNPCATRITEVTAPDYNEIKSDTSNEPHAFTFTQTITSELWMFEPLTKFMKPAQVIDWGNVKVNRSPDGNITVTSKGQAYPTIQVTYYPGDLDLSDRIEYAMKFLAMSCDASAGTGF